ncbi:MAG: hypothetical protein KAV43_00305 [Hadesarchaea archaeon]|nr:hypothetical protein [Hadesarchaea archaeon]
MAKLDIDCVVVGEGEITAVEVFEKALNGDELPRIVEGEVVPLGQIPSIKNPTVNGIVEIAGGCGRGCKFCIPTLLNFRDRPIEKILEEVKVNVDAGLDILLHAEDVLRYGAKGVIPNEEKVLGLFGEISKFERNISFSPLPSQDGLGRMDQNLKFGSMKLRLSGEAKDLGDPSEGRPYLSFALCPHAYTLSRCE